MKSAYVKFENGFYHVMVRSNGIIGDFSLAKVKRESMASYLADKVNKIYAHYKGD